MACDLCKQGPRDGCDGGWLESAPLTDGYAPRHARCPQWSAHLKANQHAAGLSAAGLDDAKYTATWDDLTLDHRAWQAARQLADQISEVVGKGLNIVSVGPTGTGKTLAAVLICRAAMQVGHTAMRLDWSRFLDSLRDGYNDRTQEPEGKKLDRVCAADLLLLDDIAAGETTTSSARRGWRRSSPAGTTHRSPPS